MVAGSSFSTKEWSLLSSVQKTVYEDFSSKSSIFNDFGKDHLHLRISDLRVLLRAFLVSKLSRTSFFRFEKHLASIKIHMYTTLTTITFNGKITDKVSLIIPNRGGYT